MTRKRETIPAKGDHPNLDAIRAEWLAGGDIAKGTTTFGEAQPERDYFDVYLNRDGSIVAYATSMELERKYLAMYGKHDPQARWAYEPPAHCKEVHRGK